METIKVSFQDKILEVSKGTVVSDLLELLPEEKDNYLGAYVNAELTHLSDKIHDDSKVNLISRTSEEGFRILTNTICTIFILALNRVDPELKARVEHFIGNGLYIDFGRDSILNHNLIKNIKCEMERIIQSDLEIKKEILSKEIVLSFFEKEGYKDKVSLFDSIETSHIETYLIDGHIFTYNGIVAPRTSCITKFDILTYHPGVMLMFPLPENPELIPKFKEQAKLSKVFRDTNAWFDSLNIGYLGDLNKIISHGDYHYLIHVAEANYENKLAAIAREIATDDDINIILIAGPSSSGKTTTASRLAIQLGVHGKRPISISSDDYFLDRNKTPLDEKGEKDFENIHAIDVKKLNDDLLSLLEGEEIELPYYDFIKGERIMSGKRFKLDRSHPIIIEGIHSLNPILTKNIPEKNKYKIYVSCLTQLNIDAHNRISTSDVRLLRRMIRDDRTRGYSPEDTLKAWTKVRAGEEKYIFPFQENANAFLDSSLIYEMCVLKKYAKRLFAKVNRDSPSYKEVLRLDNLLHYFTYLHDTTDIPKNSVLREFIGEDDE